MKTIDDSHRYCMMQYGKNHFKTIALVGKYNSREIAESLAKLARALSERGIDVMVEAQTAHVSGICLDQTGWQTGDFDAIGNKADLAMVLGGDGTMLRAARQLARYQVPLVGINQGRLGFMTDIARRDMLTCIDDLLAGKFIPESRMLLEAEVLHEGKSIGSNLALNEVVVEKGATGRLIEFELSVDNEFVYSLCADGLIASTATGSTAYSLSANGPIIHPSIPGIALVPLCPHSLTNRPILIGDQAVIEIRMTRAADSRVHFDGHVMFDLKLDDRVRIKRSEHCICFLHPPGYSYFAMLREKLHWSERPESN